MNDLRKAAEMALEMLDWIGQSSMHQDLKRKETHEALRQALSEEALDRMAAENQRLGLYDEGNLQTAIERGTKAWADVPNASEWVEELRGNNTPEVTPEVPCKTHPDAPHGFNRNASFDEDRYVCDCEFWEPVDNLNINDKCVHKSDKSMHEPVAIVNSGMGGIEWLTEQLPDDTPLYAAPYAKNDTSDRVLHKEWVGLSVNEARKFYEKYTNREELIYAIDEFLEEKNGG